MARHGDDAGAYDDMIRAGHAYGSDAATRAAIKTIWLRHYQQLSYRRGCGFNVLQAAALQAPDTVHPHASGADAGGAGRTILPREPAERDFRDFSTFELKAGLLLGLPTHLQALAQILWAVLAQRDFVHWLAHGGRWRVPYRLPGSDLAIVVVRKDGHETARLDAGTQPLLDIVRQPGSALCVEDFRSHAQQLDWLGRRQGCILVEHGLLAPDADPVPPAYALQATLLFPGYVRRVQQGAFGGFVDTLVDLHWPAHVGLTRHVPSYRFLRAFIPFFVAWHNALAHGNDTEAAAQVARLLKLPALPRKDAHAG
jgi:hypothetical protein